MFLYPLVLTANPAQQLNSSLSSNEKSLLRYGRLVARHEARGFGRSFLYGGTSWQRINAPPRAVWKAILDTPSYPKLLPQVTEARIVSQGPDHRLIFVKHGRGFPSAQYHLDLSCEQHERAAFFRIAPGRSRTLKGGDGFIVVQPYGEKQSLVTFSVMVAMGQSLLARFLRPHIQDGVLRVPQTIKRYVEGRGRSRYLR